VGDVIVPQRGAIRRGDFEHASVRADDVSFFESGLRHGGVRGKSNIQHATSNLQSTWRRANEVFDVGC
jgi:hypothetical protein